MIFKFSRDLLSCFRFLLNFLLNFHFLVNNENKDNQKYEKQTLYTYFKLLELTLTHVIIQSLRTNRQVMTGDL